MVISKDFQWKNEGMVRAFKQKSSFKILFKRKKYVFLAFCHSIFSQFHVLKVTPLILKL